jgi:hypothetical protein
MMPMTTPLNSYKQTEHVRKRETPPGRWWPAAFYGVIFILWMVTGIVAGVWDLLWLAILPLPALALYLWRTRMRVE